MFIGRIEQIEQEKGIYPQTLLLVLKYLSQQNFAAMKSGRYAVELCDNKELTNGKSDGIYLNLDRYQTKVLEDCRPERHIRYIDVQYMIEGEECLGWCPLSPDLEEVTTYDKDKDIIFYRDLVPESSLILLKGNFAVLYPDDVHRPCVAIDEPGQKVTKAVVKIPVELLEEKA